MLPLTEARRTPGHVHRLAAPERRFERGLAIAAVLVPTLGAAGAIAAWFAWGIGWTELLLWAVGHALTTYGIEIGFHRLASHGAFDTRRAVRAGFLILGSTSLQGPVVWWAAIHRRHHATSEGPGDPHSPHAKDDTPLPRWRGLWHAHIGWLFIHENTDWMHYVPDLLRDRLIFRLNRYYFLWVLLGLAVPAAIGGAVHGTWRGALLGLLWGGFLRIFTSQHATWSVNSMCHIFGARPFESRDEARNNMLFALPSMGGAWHNNHHAFPQTAINQFEWWQVDLSGTLIRILQAAGLAWNVHFPSLEAREHYRRVALARTTHNEGAGT